MPGIQLASGIVIKDEGDQVMQDSTVDDKKNHEELEKKLRGPNKSGRSWKSVRKEKASMTVLKPLKATLGSSWKKKIEEKLQRKQTRELQEELIQKKKQKIEEEKRKSAERAKRKAENELKNAKIQVMSHPEKIKKLSKKQLRQVYKTRMGDDGVVRLVGAYE